MIKKATILNLILLSCFWKLPQVFALPLPITNYVISQGKCSFIAVGKPGFLKINGEGGHVTGKVVMENMNTIVSGEAHVVMKDFKTGMTTRDEHMHNKYLESSKYTEAIFKFEKVHLKEGKIPEELKVQGTLTLHGVSKPLEATLKINSKNNEFIVDASFTLLLTDFSIDIPTFASLTVAKEVTVNIENINLTKA